MKEYSQKQIPPNPPLPKGGRGKKCKSAAWIQYRMKLKGLNLVVIARGLAPPVSPQMVGQVVLGKKRSQRIMVRIAAVLGLEFEQVWGE